MRISDWSSDVCSSDLDDARADLDQLPQHRLVAHDLGVGGDVGGRRRGAGQLDQVGPAGNLLGQALGLEPFAEGHRVVGPVLFRKLADRAVDQLVVAAVEVAVDQVVRSEEHTSELQSLMRLSYAVFCLKKKKNKKG